MQSLALCILITASALASTEISRSKRQTTYLVYYMCNNNGQRFVSNYPCSYNYANYGYNYLPQNFYDPYNNCNSGCSNLSCNQYSGQYINGQYVAYSTSNSQYSPCASSCCAYNNGYNNGYNNNGGYTIGNGANPNVYPPAGVPPTPTNPTTSNPNNIGNGASSLARSVRQINSCRSGETSIGTCSAGQRCPYNLLCSSSGQCCLCGDGVSAGPCAGGCPSGYLCASSGQCCRGQANPPTLPPITTRRPNPPTRTLPPITTTTRKPTWTTRRPPVTRTTTSTFPPITTSPGGNNGGGLQQCGPNRSCPNGSTCGDGNVCFPWIIGKK